MSIGEERRVEEGVVDFRSRRSATPEGSANARRARQLQEMRRRSSPDRDFDPVRAIRGAGWTDDLVGFWVLWHLTGGFDALVELGMHPTTVWRKVHRFRVVTGQHPDDFSFSGVVIDIDKFWSAGSTGT